MALLIIIGIISAKKGMISQSSSKDMGNILVNWVTPCVIIRAFQMEYSPEKMSGLIWTFVLSILAHIVVIVFSKLIWCKKIYVSERLSMIYSNATFMGLPLVSAIYGTEGVFYSSIFACVFQIIFWSHGISILDGGISIKGLKRILLSPAIVASAIGIVLFFSRITLPKILSESMEYLAMMNSPLAMLMAGVSVANTDVLGAFKSLKPYLVAGCKLILAPLLVAIVFRFIPVNLMIKEIIVLLISCPIAIIVSVAMTKRGDDSTDISKFFVSTTTLCIFTIPLVYILSSYIMKS